MVTFSSPHRIPCHARLSPRFFLRSVIRVKDGQYSMHSRHIAGIASLFLIVRTLTARRYRPCCVGNRRTWRFFPGRQDCLELITQFWIRLCFGLIAGGGSETRATTEGRDRGIVHSLTRDCVYKITVYLSGIPCVHAEIEHDRPLVHFTNGS
jgi:hypothetical protein